MNKRQRKKIIRKYGHTFWKKIKDTGSSIVCALILPQKWMKQTKIVKEYYKHCYRKKSNIYVYGILMPKEVSLEYEKKIHTTHRR